MKEAIIPNSLLPTVQPKGEGGFKGGYDMDLQWVWKAVLIVIIGSIILRLAGRKSISQMTVAQTVIMISIGTLLIQPVSERSIWVTFLIAGMLVVTLYVIELVQMKSDGMERFFSGHAIVVIENGELNVENLKRIRLPVDKLEMRLRQKNIQKLEDVQWATIEPNGEIGYILKPHLQYATKEDLQKVVELIQTKIPDPPAGMPMVKPEDPNNIFNEVNEGKNSSNVPKNME